MPKDVSVIGGTCQNVRNDRKGDISVMNERIVITEMGMYVAGGRSVQDFLKTLLHGIYVLEEVKGIALRGKSMLIGTFGEISYDLDDRMKNESRISQLGILSVQEEELRDAVCGPYKTGTRRKFNDWCHSF